MSYNKIQRLVAPTAVGTASASATVELMFGWRRYTSVLGYGTICTLAAVGAATTHPVYELDTSVAGAAMSNADNFTHVAASEKLGAIVERSALLKAESLTAPDAYLAAIDLNAGSAAVQGDQVQVQTKTAASFATTNPKYIAYIIVAFKGS